MKVTKNQVDAVSLLWPGSVRRQRFYMNLRPFLAVLSCPSSGHFLALHSM